VILDGIFMDILPGMCYTDWVTGAIPDR